MMRIGVVRTSRASVVPTLDLEEVKRLAKQHNCKLISISQISRVISFRKETQDYGSVRINVYWTTGTVGTCLDHPRRGKTQLFRRNINMPSLREIFLNPRVHTGDGYYRRETDPESKHITLPNFSIKLKIGDRVHVMGYADATVKSVVLDNGTYAGKILVQYDDGQTYHANPTQLFEPTLVSDDRLCRDLENEVKMQVKSLDEEVKKILEEKAKLQQILHSFEQDREKERARKEEKERARREDMRRKAEADAAAEREEQRKRKEAKDELKRYERGNYCTTRVYGGDSVDKWFDKKVVSMACGGRATILLYENGTWAFTAGLPKSLHNKLNGRQKTLPSPEYVSISSLDRYYIRFADGKSQFVGCDEMKEELLSTSRTVKSVAFGGSWDSYFIVYTDGWWKSGTMPSALSDLIGKRKAKADLTCVSIGPAGEYFMSARNGRTWWGGMSDDNSANVRNLRNRIKFMDFGDNSSYFARYS